MASQLRTVEAVPPEVSRVSLPRQPLLELVDEHCSGLGRSFQRLELYSEITPDLQRFRTLERSGPLFQIYEYAKKKSPILQKLKSIFPLMCDADHATRIADNLNRMPNKDECIEAIANVVSYGVYSMNPKYVQRGETVKGQGTELRSSATSDQEDQLDLVRSFLAVVKIFPGDGLPDLPLHLQSGGEEIFERQMANAPILFYRDKHQCLITGESEKVHTAHIVHHSLTANQDATAPLILALNFLYGSANATQILRLTMGPASYNAANLITMHHALGQAWDENKVVIYLRHTTVRDTATKDDMGGPSTNLDYETRRQQSPSTMEWVVENPTDVISELEIEGPNNSSQKFISDRESLRNAPKVVPYNPPITYFEGLEPPASILLDFRANLQHGLERLLRQLRDPDDARVPIYSRPAWRILPANQRRYHKHKRHVSRIKSKDSKERSDDFNARIRLDMLSQPPSRMDFYLISSVARLHERMDHLELANTVEQNRMMSPYYSPDLGASSDKFSSHMNASPSLSGPALIGPRNSSAYNAPLKTSRSGSELSGSFECDYDSDTTGSGIDPSTHQMLADWSRKNAELPP